MAKPKVDKKKMAKAIQGMVGKARELGWSPDLTEEELKKAQDIPNFVYVKLSELWGPWKRGKKGNQGGFILSWGVEKIGFGELTFVLKDGKAICDTETMGKAFAMKTLFHFLSNGVVYDPKAR